MATNIPGLKKVGAYWHYELRVGGRRLHGSTKAADLPTAKRILDSIRKDALDGQFRLVRRVPTLKEVLDEWWGVHEGIHSRSHRRSVDCLYRKWVHPALGGIPVDQITTQRVLRLRAGVIAKGCSPRYANNLLQVLKLLGRFACKMGYTQRLYFEVAPLRLQKKPRPIVPASRVQDFLQLADTVAKNPQVPVMFRVLLGLGLREGELLGMRWEWFDFDQRTYTVGKAKGKEARVIPVPDWVWHQLVQLPRLLSPWVFPGGSGKPHSARYLQRPLERLARKLGLPGLTQHRLRASFASLHADAGTPISEIQGLLGHKQVQTTMIYVEESLAAKRRSQDGLARQLGLA